MVLADARTGEILGEVGSADFFDASRSGWIDMTKTIRSPGSTLKPFIYGLALEQGLVAQETLIEDRPADFAGYRPKNFDMSYQGDVSVRQALQLSLNVPAVRLLDAVGPARLIARFRQAGVTPALPPGEAPGLAIGLGGVGVTLRDLVQLYTGLSNGGEAKRAARRHRSRRAPRRSPTARCSTARPPGRSPTSCPASSRRQARRRAASPTRPAPPTATATPGRSASTAAMCSASGSAAPMPASVPGLSGYVSAAPILFEGFAKSGLAAVPLRRPPAGAFRPKREDLPVTLERFASRRRADRQPTPTEPAPQIVFPPDGARVDLGAAGGRRRAAGAEAAGRPRALPLARQRQAARRRRTPPHRHLAARRRRLSTLTVIDAAGRAASVSVFVE